MSVNNYITEPMTEGKVILHTTVGPLDVELWAKQAPKATRNFMQLCMEGYYNGKIFHRIVKDFLVQGGDPTGTGTGGESIYGEPFKDEFHSRLRFSHRGIVACASFEKNMNGSQFFITLTETPELNKKNIIFGKVTGDTIFNLQRFNNFEVGENDRPLKPPVIERVEILWNPFDDIVVREYLYAKKEEKVVEEKKNLAPMQKNLSLLSFGDEAEEEEEIVATAPKIVSAHKIKQKILGIEEKPEEEEEFVAPVKLEKKIVTPAFEVKDEAKTKKQEELEKIREENEKIRKELVKKKTDKKKEKTRRD